MDLALVARGRRLGRGRHSLLDLARHRHKRVLDIRRVLRRGLKEGDVDLI